MKSYLLMLMNDEPGAGGGGVAEGDQGAANGGGSALSSGGEQQLAIHERIPEKFRVFEGEGEAAKFNLEASTSKLADSYSSMEKRLGEGHTAPDSPDGYEIDGKAIAEDFDVEAFMGDELNKSFLAKAHAHGMSNKQVQMVMEHAMKEMIPNLTAGNKELDSESCTKSLQSEIWKDGAEFKENMGAANRLFRSLPDGLREQVDAKLGNDPLFIQVAAMFGKEMAEDTPANGAQGGDSQANIEELMLSEAYKDNKHPQHEAVSKKVRAHFERAAA
ncbi:MAG: hypothetical protein KKF24_10735 [Gammaproteobacteria bacterium]|nr:hypothetical protein [Gammaproteobacteria bacterium]MBU1833160.1 hypothetical protein [Gammaproteobacteria bacterium]